MRNITKAKQRTKQRTRIARSIKLIRALNEAYNPNKKPHLISLMLIASNYPKIKV